MNRAPSREHREETPKGLPRGSLFDHIEKYKFNAYTSTSMSPEWKALLR